MCARRVQAKWFGPFIKIKSRKLTSSPPTCAALACTTYDGAEMGDDVSVLTVDHAIDCRSEEYRTFMQIYAIIMIIVLPVGLLLVALVGLLRLRGELEKVQNQSQERATLLDSGIGLTLVENNVLSKSPLQPLFSAYKPHVAWWYDIADMFRRLVLTCLTVSGWVGEQMVGRGEGEGGC